MTNDRGGRGYRGGGYRGGARGRGRGGSFLGAGQSLGGGFNDDSPRGGRGRGGGGYRGRGRGGALTMQAQNAVGFDYSRLHAGSRGPAAPADADAAQPDDNDVVLEPPRGYVHVARPQHEGQPSRTSTAQQAAMARPALQGDHLASMLDVPSGPRAMRLSGGTAMPARGTRQRIPTNFPHFPMPASSFSRPAEVTGDSAFLAGLGLGKPKGGARSGDPAARRALLIPVQFVKATGTWKDGAMHDSETLHGPTEASKEALAQGKTGRGLGFTEPVAETKQPAPAAMDFTFTPGDDDEDEDLAALLSAYPGAVRELAPNEASWVDTTHLLPTSTQLASTPARAPSNDEEDEEEVILITQTVGAARGAPGESDSEEERQLDAILAASAAQAADVSMAEAEEAAFFIDTTPALASEVTALPSDTLALGDELPAPRVEPISISDSDSYTDDEGMPNMTQRQPRGQGKKARNAAKKARRRARKSEPAALEQPRVPREGDSDLEWGEAGPPRMRDAAMDVSEDEEASTEQLVAALKLGGESKASPRAKKQTAQEALLEDLIAAAELGAQPGSDEEEDASLDKPTQLDAMIRFMNSMDGQRGGQQVTLDDIAIEQRMQEEDEWMTESESDDAVMDGDETMQAAMAYEERVLAEEFSSSAEESESTDSEDSEDEEPAPRRGKGKATVQQQRKGKGRAVDEDEELTWADADEEFIGMIERVAQDNDHVLKGRNRTERNKLFRAIERGDFGDLDDFDDDDEDDEDVAKPVKGGYAGKKKWNVDEPFADDLQLQWEKDRATKAANKRKRAAERAAAAADPYQNTHKKGTKKLAKKAARAARRAERAGVKVDVAEEALEDSDEPMSFATNLHELDVQIQRFLRDAAHTTLSLAPMDKRARAQVHMLASAYSLKSQSRGSGAKRFPVLMKNSRSGLNVDQRRVRVILGGGDAGFGSGAKWAPKKGKKSAGAGGGGGGGIAVPRNQEGAEVGFGAEKIGEDNIGHKLLTMMGWKEGSGVGASPGISSAIGATIKVSKGGLGF